jgi:hypothetical protein
VHKGSLEKEEEEDSVSEGEEEEDTRRTETFLIIKAENQFKPCGRTRAQ